MVLVRAPLLLALALGSLLTSASAADVASGPSASPAAVLAAVYRHARLDPRAVTVRVFRYDYLRAEWQIELMPRQGDCLDCLPSFYVRDLKGLQVRTLPHG